MVSIIIPVLNEEKSIENLLKQVNRLDGDKEIIVVDGGSCDQTVYVASKYARVVESKKGRGNQMNEGAKVAVGEILWFLHSDSIINPHSLKKIEETMDKGFVGGGFSLYFHDHLTFFMKFVSQTSNWRAKYLGLYFGDQAIFVKKKVFERIGGYAPIEIMEDWELSRILKKYGRMKMLGLPIGTSARRFKKGGQLKTLLFMHKIKVLYVIGVSPDKLIKIYREVR